MSSGPTKSFAIKQIETNYLDGWYSEINEAESIMQNTWQKRYPDFTFEIVTVRDADIFYISNCKQAFTNNLF